MVNAPGIVREHLALMQTAKEGFFLGLLRAGALKQIGFLPLFHKHRLMATDQLESDRFTQSQPVITKCHALSSSAEVFDDPAGMAARGQELVALLDDEAGGRPEGGAGLVADVLRRYSIPINITTL